MINFIKLNNVSGICKIIAYSEESDELKAVFELNYQCNGVVAKAVVTRILKHL